MRRVPAFRRRGSGRSACPPAAWSRPARHDALIGGFVIAGPIRRAEAGCSIHAVGPIAANGGIPRRRLRASSDDPARHLRRRDPDRLQQRLDRPRPMAAPPRARPRAGPWDFPLVDWAGGGGDSALVLTLARPGAYTAVVAPAPGAPPGDQTGRVGLVEIYDLSPADGSRLVNISSRGRVGSANRRQPAGSSAAPWPVQRPRPSADLRGVGPALASLFGLPDPLPNPIADTCFDRSGAEVRSQSDDERRAFLPDRPDSGPGPGRHRGRCSFPFRRKRGRQPRCWPRWSHPAITPPSSAGRARHRRRPGSPWSNSMRRVDGLLALAALVAP